MKQLTAVLLCLLLCGCGREAPPVHTETIPVVPVMADLYDPDHPIEKEYPGLVRAYPLLPEDTYGIHTVGKDVLLLSGRDCTAIALFTGENLRESAGLMLDFRLEQDDPSLQIHRNSISFFDPLQQQTIVLDHSLREIRRIAAPDGLSGKPILANDAQTLFYCTGWSVVAWDLASGIRRTVKELSCEEQELTALHLDGRILECSIRDAGTAAKQFLSADQGRELRTLPEEAVIVTEEDRYFAALTGGHQTLLVFGKADALPELLLTEKFWNQHFYLPADHAAVTVSSTESGTQLDYYELNTGILRSSLNLGDPQTLRNIVNGMDHSVYILSYDSAADCDILYRWDVLRQTPDPTNTDTYTAAYYCAENPDTEALEACREYAESIGEKYGITVRIWEDAVKDHPWDYRFEPEHLAAVLQKELKLLDKRLAQYPESILQQTKSRFSGLTLCLVREIIGTDDEQSLSTATGIQFFEAGEAYVVITTGNYSEQALYHELYHVMETHILTESSDLDSWEALNPAGFTYGSNQSNTDIYLQGQTRAFADRYSMRAMKEDRARVLENALLQGNQELFRSEYMQRKLRAMCTGIREAYGLKKHPEALPWEQYLVTPLTPKG